jgi:hypothetical protein
MPAGKVYRKPARKYRKKAKGQAYRNKMRGYNKANKRGMRNRMRPFVETMFREVDRSNSHHIIFNNTTAAASVAVTPQMSINNANNGSGTNHAAPQDFTVIVPQAWSDLFTQGVARDQIQGRNIYPTYLNSKVEIDFSAHTTQPEAEVGLDDHYYIIQGWAKNSLIKQVGDELDLPDTSAAAAVAMGQIVAKCCQQSGVNGDVLDFVSKKKDIKIMKQFAVKPNLNNRYLAAVVDAGNVNPEIATATAYALPKVYNFSWTIKRKQLLRGGTRPGGLGNQFMFADSWVPFVGFYNRRLTATSATHPPGS